GEFFCDASYSNVAEALLNNFAEVGINSRLRPLERAAFFKAYAEKSLKNIIFGGSGAFGNAATRMEAFYVKGGTYAYGSYPDIDELFQQQAVELDHKKRAACADLALGLPQRRRTASRRARFRADPRLRLHRTLRRHHAERRVIRRGDDSGIPDLW